MEHPEEHYYKLNRFLISVSGLCPYQSKKSARLRRTVFSVVLLSSMFAQISSMFTSDITMDYIVNEIPPLLIMLGTLGGLYLRSLNVDKFRELFERMSKDWALQKTKDEIKIMHEHAEASRLFIRCFFILQYTGVIGYNVWMFVPDILDVISPMNESRPRIQPFKVEYFIDEERYFYIIRSHFCIVIFIAPLIVLAISSLFIIFTQHACGMCELLRYRAERLFCIVEGATGCDLTTPKINCRNIVVFIQLHYNVIKFVDIIETCHTVPFLVDLIGIVAMVSLTLFQVLNISNFERAIKSVGISLVGLTFLFISCYMGQKIMEKSSSIYEKLFNSMWYNALISEQKALLIIMMRRNYPLLLTAYKFYVMSLQNFGMILQTAISYCLFIRQL